MVAKKAPAKTTAAATKTAAKKVSSTTTTAAKKTTAKKTTAKKTTAPPATTVVDDGATAVSAVQNPVVSAADPSGLQPEDSKSAESIAREILAGSRRYGSGKDRVALLTKAGHDAEAVRKAVNRLRRQQNK
jgi:hypothetical protein